MQLQIQADNRVTLIENTFIDRFMPAANGEFVKLYIYLLRCVGSRADLSVSSIADFFDHTEKDVIRALTYWEKLGLLKLDRDSSDNISVITLTNALTAEQSLSSPAAGQNTSGKAAGIQNRKAADAVPVGQETVSLNMPDTPVSGIPAGNPLSESTGQSAAPEIPSKRSISAARKRELQTQEEIRQLIFVAETLFHRPLTSTEVSNLLYFYDGLHFSCELIEYLLEYCAGKGDPGTRYMEKIALDWYSRSISTVAQAKEDSLRFNSDYFQILGFLGIKGRNPIEKETEYMNRWLDTWHLPIELIREACSRTVMQTSQPSIQYADRILKSWHDAGAATSEDIAALDEAHARRQNASAAAPMRSTSAAAAVSSGSMQRGKTASRNRFNNFQQRGYDYVSLEQQLLQAQARKED